MEDDIDNEEKLFNEFVNLRKYSSNLAKLHSRLMANNFTCNDWKKERKKINLVMKNYSTSLEKVEQFISSVKGDNSKSKEQTKKITENLRNIKKECEPKYKEMEAKIENFKIMNKGGDDDEEEEEESKVIKDSIDIRIENEKEVLENKEESLIANEKKEEKNEEKKVERSDNKKTFLGIQCTRKKIIATILIVIIIILVVVTIIVVCKIYA